MSDRSLIIAKGIERFGYVRSVEVLAEAVSIPAGGPTAYDHPIPKPHTGALIMVRVTYDPAATAGAEVRTFPSHDGIEFDTEPLDTLTPKFTAGASVRQSFIIAVPCHTLRVEVRNLDGAVALTLDRLVIITTP